MKKNIALTLGLLLLSSCGGVSSSGKQPEKMGYEVQSKQAAPAGKQELKGILLADSVDPRALTAFVEAQIQERASIPKTLERLSGKRAALDEDQRKAWAERISGNHPRQEKKFGAMRDELVDRLVAELKLTEAQRPVVDALRTQLKTFQPSPKERRAAMAAFMLSGDEEALALSLEKLEAKLPVAELVSFVVVLDKNQREILLRRIGGFFGKGHGKRRFNRQ